MKKTAVLTTILLVLCLFSLLVACTGSEEPQEDVRYKLDLTIRESQISGTETVTYVNTYQDGLSNGVFHLYANAYREDATHPAFASPLGRYGGIELSSVRVNGQDATASYDDSREYVTVEHLAVKKGETVQVDFSYDLTIPDGKLRLSYNDGDYALSGFYPQLAVYQNGAFCADAFSRTGDPYYSAASRYDVTITLPKNEVVGASVPVKKTSETEETQTVTMTGEGIRDFAVAASPDYKVLTAEAGDVTVLYLYEDDEDPDVALQAAKSAVEAFSKAFYDYPYESFTVARTLFEEDGMEFSGMTFVASDTRDVVGTVLHETAHQWWYGLVGSDPIRESYMDEGLATFSAAYYYALQGDENKFREEIDANKRAYATYERLQKMRKTDALLSMNKPVYDYTAYQYAMVAYCKGCMMFDSLYELFGKEKFEACLREYCKQNAYGFGGYDAFVAAANETMGDVGGLMNGWIGEGAVATTFAVT